MKWWSYLGSTGTILLSQHKHLKLVITSKHTGTSNCTKNVCTSTLEERFRTLILKDLIECIQGTLVLHGFTWCHHHSSADCVNWIGGEACTVCDNPTKSKASEETILKSSKHGKKLKLIHKVKSQMTTKKL